MDEPGSLETGRKLWKTIVGSTVTGLTVIGGVLGIWSFLGTYTPYDLNGAWTVTNTIQSTTDSAYKDLRLGYHMFLVQKETDISGTGEKWSENDEELPPKAHTHITMMGSIKGTKVTGSFQEEGALRKTEGTFDWNYQKGTKSLSGTFTSTAANASGPSMAQRASAPAK